MIDINKDNECFLVLVSSRHELLTGRRYSLDGVIEMADDMARGDEFIKYSCMMHTRDLLEEAIIDGKDFSDDEVFQNALLHIRYTKAFDSALNAWNSDNNVYPLFYIVREDVAHLPEYKVTVMKNMNKSFPTSLDELAKVAETLNTPDTRH